MRVAPTDPAETLRQGHAAFNDRDRERLLDSIAEDVTWHSSGNGPLAGTYDDRDALWNGFFAPAWEAPIRLEDREVFATDEYAAAVTDLVIGAGDDEQRWKLVEVARVRDGEIVERWSFNDRQEELDRFMQQLA